MRIKLCKALFKIFINILTPLPLICYSNKKFKEHTYESEQTDLCVYYLLQTYLLVACGSRSYKPIGLICLCETVRFDFNIQRAYRIGQRDLPGAFLFVASDRAQRVSSASGTQSEVSLIPCTREKEDPMNPNVTLTLATEKDAELIHLMKYEAFLPLYEIYRDDETSPVKEPIEKVIAILERKASEYYIIKADGLSVGAIRVCHRKRDYEPPKGEVPAYISPLFILPRFQNKGIAQIAVKKVFDLYPEATVW